MIANGNVTRYIIDGGIVVLIGVFGWMGNEAKKKVDIQEARIQAVELQNARLEPKIDYIVKSLDELKYDFRQLKKTMP
jgi:hypothetical protein